MGREMAPENPPASERENRLSDVGRNLIDNLIDEKFGSMPLAQILAAFQAESEKLESMRRNHDENEHVVQGRVDALKRLIEKKRAAGEAEEGSK